MSVALTSEAQDAYKRYRRALKEESYEPGVPEFMQGVLGKMVAYLARLSLILALVRVAVSDGDAREEIEREDVDRAHELVRYFVSHSFRLYGEVKEEDKRTILARALGELLEECGGLWRGSATQLQEKLKAMGYAHALPKVPDNLTQQVMSACTRTPALTAQRGRNRNEGRWIEIRWARDVGGGDRP